MSYFLSLVINILSFFSYLFLSVISFFLHFYPIFVPFFLFLYPFFLSSLIFFLSLLHSSSVPFCPFLFPSFPSSLDFHSLSFFDNFFLSFTFSICSLSHISYLPPSPCCLSSWSRVLKPSTRSHGLRSMASPSPYGLICPLGGISSPRLPGKQPWSGSEHRPLGGGPGVWLRPSRGAYSHSVLVPV